MASACCEGNPMATMKHVNPDDIRTLFSRAMSEMYRAEERGAALTPKGRKIYDDLLASVRGEVQVGSSGENASGYATELAQRFKTLPDDWSTLRAEGLAFFRYSAPRAGIEAVRRDNLPRSIEALIANGCLRFDPIIYEDFLPVSAAGIFRSNLGGDAQHHFG